VTTLNDEHHHGDDAIERIRLTQFSHGAG